jgi:hypothetical protein
LISPATAANLVLNTTIFEGEIWSGVSDHRPIMIGMKVPGGRKTSLPKDEKKKEYFLRHSPDQDTILGRDNSGSLH